MLTDLTRTQVDHYRENGFVAVERLLDDGELALWREVFDAAVAERGDTRIPGFDGEIGAGLADDDEAGRAALDYYRNTFRQRVNLWQTNQRMRELILDSRLGRLAAQLAGVDRLRVWHDQALVKGGYGNPTAFHLDVPYWSFTSDRALTIWIALDDATLENGCLWFTPRSHTACKYDNVAIGPELGALFDVYPEWRGVPAVPCPVPAGGCTFHNGLTFHGAGANMTPRPRRAMTCAYMPDGVTFNGEPNILRPEQLARLRVGDVLADDDQNPLVWDAAAAPAAVR